jgi:sugar phosphate isomerase/epimerase
MLEDSSALAEFRRILADHGATVSALSSHGNALHPDQARAKRDREVSRKTILLAEKARHSRGGRLFWLPW